MKRRVGWAAALLGLGLAGGCDDDDDWTDPGRTPERSVPTEPERGPLERAGEAADRALDEAGEELREGADRAGDAADEAGGALRRGVERAGDAAEDAGDWVEDRTDIDGDVHDTHPDDAPR